jgi:uncharacterized membrane protein YedE/YeeE
MTPHAVSPSLSRSRVNAGLVVAGVALGFALSRIGFTDYDALVGMFTFVDVRMFLVFALGVVLTAVGLVVTGRWRAPKRALTKSAVVGGVIFGVGWAVAGACPGVAFAQVGEGKLWALVSIAGMAVGTLAFHRVRDRFAFAPSSCTDGDGAA